MRTKLVFISILVAAALAAGFALANLGGDSRDKAPAPSSSTSADLPSRTPRDEAVRNYRDGSDDAKKAEQELAAGKAKNAAKKFKRGLDRGEQAVALDSTYYEAWNLVGFCARHLGQYDKSLAAYGRCLRLKPDYVLAREYLGEAYIELGDMTKAREQLAWLERLKADDEAKELKEKIEAWAAAHPDKTMKPMAVDSLAPVDTMKVPTGGSDH